MAKARATPTAPTTNADLYSVKKASRYAELRCRKIDPNYRSTPIVRMRSPREAQKRRMQGWTDCRFILPRLTLEGLRTLAGRATVFGVATRTGTVSD
jgi:hypothetical protein